MRIVFLDIDGVLAPHGRPNPDVWCHDTCSRLERFIDTTGAKVVLVSSWPVFEAQANLSDFGISLHDAIAEKDRRGGLGRYGLFAREAGIVDYLETHKPEAWVWLDDFGALHAPLPHALNTRNYKNHPLASGYVQTNWFYDDGEGVGAGFDDAAYQRAMVALTNTASAPMYASDKPTQTHGQT